MDQNPTTDDNLAKIRVTQGYFESHASFVVKERLRHLERERNALIESQLRPLNTELWNKLSLFPSLTHVTLAGNLSKIFSPDEKTNGLEPVEETKNGSLDLNDSEFPELELRKRVHCGWGGIDSVSIPYPDGVVVLLIKSEASDPTNLVTMLDWRTWGPIEIEKKGGDAKAKKEAAQYYLTNLKKAGDYDLNPYSLIRSHVPNKDILSFLHFGLNRKMGHLDIPTILIRKVKIDDIKGIITPSGLKNHPAVVSLPENVSKLEWDNLKEGSLPREGRNFAILSQKARYAEAIIDGRQDEFLKIFTSGASTLMEAYLEVDKKAFSLLYEAEKLRKDEIERIETEYKKTKGL